MMKYQDFEKKIWKIVQKPKSEIVPHYKSHWDTQNQLRLENYPNVPLNVPLNETHETTWRGLLKSWRDSFSFIF